MIRMRRMAPPLMWLWLQSPGLSGYSTNAGGGRDDDPKKAPNAIPVDSQWDEVKMAVTRLQHLLEDAQQHPEPQPAPVAAAPSGNGKSLTDELRDLAELRDAGILDEDEFKSAKQRLIDQPRS